MPDPIEPLTLEFDEAGLPYSSRYGDRYASRDGALAQARHVFLAGNELPARWAKRDQFVILETGFGLGTNFIAAWQAWRADPARPRRLHFVSIEKHPLSLQDMQSLARNTVPGLDGDETAELRAQLAGAWPLPLAGLHRLEFEQGNVILTLVLGDATDWAPDLRAGVDAFFLDGFAPDCNPEMWEPALMRSLARLARPDATVATYSCARRVRDALTANSFDVRTLPGFAGKREMLAGRFAPRYRMRRHEPPPAQAADDVIVVGAGLAGCAVTHALARRGWRVRLLDQAGRAAAGASALPAGLLYPLLSEDDNLASRLSRAGFLYALRLLEGIEPTACTRDGRSVWAPCGVFQVDRDSGESVRLGAGSSRPQWPDDFARAMPAIQAGERIGLAPARGGIWFNLGAVVDAGRLCRALLAPRGAPSPTSGRSVSVEEFAAGRMQRHDGQWIVTRADGARRCAPFLVLANASEIAGLLPGFDLPMQRIGGRVSLFESAKLAGLHAGVSGDGYLAPPLLGMAAAGATFEVDEASSPRSDAAAHRANLKRIGRLLAVPSLPQPDAIFAAERCATRDRQPLAGAIVDEAVIAANAQDFRGAHLADLPRLPGLFCLAGLGSRGIALAPLLGETIASMLAGEPLPIEGALQDAIDPGRFALRAFRSSEAQ